MKEQLADLVKGAMNSLKQQAVIEQFDDNQIAIERTRDETHGDFASNIALITAKAVHLAPRDLAEKIIAALPENNVLDKVEIAGPGFINFTINRKEKQLVVTEILKAKEQFGRSQAFAGKHVNLEFVSANPTGPLHVGHGRGAAYGSVLASLLNWVGYDVHCEYLVNDAGRQMRILALSTWLRYLQLSGLELTFPINGYKGDYLEPIAQALKTKHPEQYVMDVSAVFANVFPDEGEEGGDKERHVDDLIECAKSLLGQDHFQSIMRFTLECILSDIREDLDAFHVHFDEWFSERSLFDNAYIQKATDRLTELGYTYDKSGALWFKSTEFGDDKDRVLIRDNGDPTYFASDAAYILNKLDRKFDQNIIILGADHHGYVPRLQALVQAFCQDKSFLEVKLVQFAVLYSQGQQVQMSTRSGSFVTLRQLRNDVGNDASRFFYVMRRCEQHLDFDLDLAKEQSNANPVYYIQYAYARISSIFRQLDEKQLNYDQSNGLLNLSTLSTSHEQELLDCLSQFPETILSAGRNYEPHLLVYYLKDLATAFHTYYNSEQFLVEDGTLRNSRLALISAVSQVIKNGMGILGISTPEVM